MLYAAVAACLAMLATSGIVAYATAASSSEPTRRGERELIADLDRLIARQLDEVKARLIP
jgi:hypothetical protein